MSGYDIIDDIHGQADRLRLLLTELGYVGLNFAHAEGRRVIFLGDFINRGPQNKETIEIVQKIMGRGGLAVMGNHEFKAICYSKTGIHGNIRPHTESNTAEHTAFLEEFPYGSDSYRRTIDWFKTLPVYIRMRDFNVVHACWSERSIRTCWPHMRKKDGTLKESTFKAYDTENPTPFSSALDVLLKGPRYKLPRGVNYLDGRGHPSKEMRVLWWRDQRLLAAEFLEKGGLIGQFLSAGNERQVLNLRNNFNYALKHPVFIGHYNVPSEPKIDSPKVACLNHKGYLTAYRWNDGDTGLLPDRLVYV